MEKINVLHIVAEHFSTLKDAKTGKHSHWDFAVFLGLPGILSVFSYFSNLKMPEDIISTLVAIFSIFAALLFSAQIALFSLKPSTPTAVEDELEQEKRDKKFEKQKLFFKQVNKNTSYLILFACFALISFLVLEVVNFDASTTGGVISFLVSHFFLTLMMLIKRTHIAFSIGHELQY